MATATSVMVLDDDMAIRELLGELLAEEGYQVLACATTAEADAQLAAQLPALLLLDMRLGGESGGDWLARRRLDGATLPPVVAMSAADIPVATRAQLQIVDVLAKPFDIQNLLACVARYHRRPAAPHCTADRPDPRQSLAPGGMAYTLAFPRVRAHPPLRFRSFRRWGSFGQRRQGRSGICLGRAARRRCARWSRPAPIRPSAEASAAELDALWEK